jgi:tetratricopeptide (TPR) repeat protein
MSRGHHFLVSIGLLCATATACRAGGNDKDPKRSYTLTAPPAQALEMVAGLGKVAVTDDEKGLFAEARAGKLDRWTFSEVTLLASGVTDAGARKTYLAKIDDIVARARKATEGAKSPHEKGEKLLQSLHEGPMAKGYESNQTLLSTLLDTGKFNCVSSAVLYNVVAGRLGLEARAVEIPGHVYSVLYVDGKPIDVETTNAHGFDPANPEQREKLRKEKGITVLADKHAGQGRELGDLGLTAVIWANRSASLSEAKRYHEAALAGFRALCLDPESPTALKNAQAALNNGCLHLSAEGKHEEAERMAGVGLELDPANNSLRNNHVLACLAWAESLRKAGKEDDALAVLRRAADRAPKDHKKDYQELQARLYTRPGEELVKAGEWDKALALAKGGLSKIDEEARQDLRRWRNGLFLRWADAEQKGNVEKAVAVLEKGMAVDPEERNFANNLACLVHDRAKELDAAGKPDEAKAFVAAMQKRFEKCHDVQQVGAWFVRDVVDGLTGQSKFDEALKAQDRYAGLIKDQGDAEDVVLRIYNAEAKPHVDKEKWAEAIAVFEKGLKRFPKHAGLKQNLEYYQAMAKKGASSRVTGAGKPSATASL